MLIFLQFILKTIKLFLVINLKLLITKYITVFKSQIHAIDVFHLQTSY